MHDVINYLKEAVLRDPTAGALGCYVARGGSLFAQNNVIMAGVAWAAGTDLIFPAAPVEAALARMPTVEEIKVSDGSILLRSGRLRSTIQRYANEGDVPGPELPEAGWSDAPEGLADALALAAKFVGNRNWTAGIVVEGDRLLATDGNSLIDIEVPGFSTGAQRLLPAKSAAFVSAAGDPAEYAEDDVSISFRWDDGRWMKTKLIDDSMPEQLRDRIFGDAGAHAPVEVTDDWKAAAGDAEALGDGPGARVTLTSAGLLVRRESLVSDIDLKGMPTGHESHWGAASLSKVVGVARAWNPASYPKPALFVGPGFRGVLSCLAAS